MGIELKQILCERSYVPPDRGLGGGGLSRYFLGIQDSLDLCKLACLLLFTHPPELCEGVTRGRHVVWCGPGVAD